ncbi:hypothetical protein GJAV_G00048840 [Gymnothorax javanicus]|nr:hypothetical protein GJAV_G00048840 [Gymnothorax javanicus]
MAKSVKKGGRRKVTEVEKQLFLQQKALAEEEKRKRQQAMLFQELTSRMEVEEQASVMSELRLDETWQPALQRDRAKELRDDIAVLSQSFERAVDLKGTIIKYLEAEVNSMWELSARCFASHLDQFYRLLERQREQLSTLEQQWKAAIEELCTAYRNERELILAQHRERCMSLEELDFPRAQRHNELLTDTRIEFLSTSHDIKETSKEMKTILQARFRHEAEQVWHQIQEADSSYTNATESRNAEFQSLLARDKRSVQEVDAQMKQIKKMRLSIAQVRSRLASAQRDRKEGQKPCCIRDEMTRQARQLSGQLTADMQCNRCRLTRLILSSDRALKQLRSIVKKGSRLLQLAELCRKLEREDERSLQFYCSPTTPEEHSPEPSTSAEPQTRELAEAVQQNSGLECMRQRYNKVLLERLCLGRERAELMQQNAELRLTLCRYLDGTTVNHRIMTQPNTLLMVNKLVRPCPEPPVARHTEPTQNAEPAPARPAPPTARAPAHKLGNVQSPKRPPGSSREDSGGNRGGRRHIL